MLFVLPILSVMTFISKYISTSYLNTLEQFIQLLPIFTIFLLSYELEDITIGFMSAFAYIIKFGVFNDYRYVPIALLIGIVVYFVHKVSIKLINTNGITQHVPYNAASMIDVYLQYILSFFLVFLIMKITFIWNLIWSINIINLHIMSHPVTYFVILFVTMIFWLYGLHGDMVSAPYLEPILILMMIKNISEVDDLSIINASFHTVFFAGTGSGMTFSLIISILLFSKSKDEKDNVKTNIMSGIFNINEGIVFGLPLVGNKDYTVPFVIAPIVSVLSGYMLTVFGIIEPMKYSVPWITPPIIKSFIASGGDYKAVLAELFSFVLGFAVYSIFVLRKSRRDNKCSTISL